MRDELLTYDDLVRIVELIRSTEAYAEFHLKLGGIETDLHRLDASGAAPAAAPLLVPPTVPPSVPPPPPLERTK